MKSTQDSRGNGFKMLPVIQGDESNLWKADGDPGKSINRTVKKGTPALPQPPIVVCPDGFVGELLKSETGYDAIEVKEIESGENDSTTFDERMAAHDRLMKAMDEDLINEIGDNADAVLPSGEFEQFISKYAPDPFLINIFEPADRSHFELAAKAYLPIGKDGRYEDKMIELMQMRKLSGNSRHWHALNALGPKVLILLALESLARREREMTDACTRKAVGDVEATSAEQDKRNDDIAKLAKSNACHYELRDDMDKLSQWFDYDAYEKMNKFVSAKFPHSTIQ